MELTWLGRFCFRIKGKNATVLTDPYDLSFVYPSRQPPPDVVTFSQEVLGIERPQANGQAPKVLSGPGEYEVSRVLITGIGTFQNFVEASGTKRREKNTVYFIEIDGITLCHLGALEQSLTSAQVENLSQTKILLAPVGRPSWLKASLETLSLLEPKIVVPMHYQIGSEESEPKPFDRFLKEMGIKEFQPLPKLTVNESSIPEQTQVVLLSPQTQ